jgi:hypothetical protein
MPTPTSSATTLPQAPPQNISAAAVAAEFEASTLRLQVRLRASNSDLTRLMDAQVLGLQDLDLSVRGHRLLSQLDRQFQAW